MLRPRWSGVGIAVSLRLHRAGDDADVGDACLFDGVHDGSESTEGDGLVGAEIDDAFGGIGGADGFEAVCEVGYVDWFVLEEDVLVLVDGDDHALFGELIDGTGFGDGDFDAGLKDGGGKHEDEEQDENDVDERGDVDLGEGGLGASFCGEGHGLEGPPADGFFGEGSGGRRGDGRGHGCVLDCVEELAAEVVHARGELAEAGGELVVADDGGNGDDEAGGGGDEGFGDAGGDGA